MESGISVTFFKSGEHDSINASISRLNNEIGNKFRLLSAE
jgi:hypothetical protein